MYKIGTQKRILCTLNNWQEEKSSLKIKTAIIEQSPLKITENSPTSTQHCNHYRKNME
jgi:hypothetical protein